MRKRFYFFIVLLTPAIGFCQLNIDSVIVVNVQQEPVAPAKFYIRDVVDSRTNKSINSFSFSSLKINPDTNPLSIETLFKQVFDQFALPDPVLMPVEIDIKEFEIVPAGDSSRMRKELRIELQYNTFINQRKIQFGFFSFTQGLYRYMESPAFLSGLLSNEFYEIGKRLNVIVDSVHNQIPYNGLKIMPVFFSGESTPDTLFYKQLNKLLPKNFKGQLKYSSDTTALTASSFSYTISQSMKDGYLQVVPLIKCFFLCNQSWIGPAENRRSLLAHEQLHFDITYLKSLEFFRESRLLNANVDNWNDQLDSLLSIKFQEMELLQKQYDGESDYGRKPGKQKYWRMKIDQKIKESLPEKEGFLPGLMN